MNKGLVQYSEGRNQPSGADDRAPRWFVVQTKPHAESRATLHLERQGFDVFCPRLRNVVRHARRPTATLTSLFPGYLFLQLDTLSGWRSVNGTRGVVRIVSQGDEPQPLPCGVVEVLRARLDAHGVLIDMPVLQVGQYVRVVQGPFENLIGTLEQFDGVGRVRVLLTLLGRSVAVKLRSDVLAAAA